MQLLLDFHRAELLANGARTARVETQIDTAPSTQVPPAQRTRTPPPRA